MFRLYVKKIFNWNALLYFYKSTSWSSARILLLKLNYLEKVLYIQLLSVFQSSKGVDFSYENVSTFYDIFKRKMIEKKF